MRRSTLSLLTLLILTLLLFLWMHRDFFEVTGPRKVLPQAPRREEATPQNDAATYRALLEDPNLVIRMAAARVLLAQGNRSGEEVLLQALHGNDTRFRIDAFYALSGSLVPERIPVLEEALEKEKNPLASFVMKRVLKDALKAYNLEEKP